MVVLVSSLVEEYAAHAVALVSRLGLLLIPRSGPLKPNLERKGILTNFLERAS